MGFTKSGTTGLAIVGQELPKLGNRVQRPFSSLRPSSANFRRFGFLSPPPATPDRSLRSVRRVQGVADEGLGLSTAQTTSNGAAEQQRETKRGLPNPFTAEEVLPRVGKVSRVTKETSVDVRLNLDGTGICKCDTGIPFLDHMLDQLASHGLLDVEVTAKGDIHIDDHHTNEDIGLAVGTALLQALGDRKGIYRFGDFTAPLDEALVHVVLDLSGRPYLGYDVNIPTQRVGTYDTQLVEHFFQSLINTSGMTLHIRQLAGKNSHHIIEATFKAFARALRQAMEYDIRRKGTIPREEADELCRTGEQNEGRERTISEMADVLYHSMVLLAVQVVKLKEVLEALRERFSKSGMEEKINRSAQK